MAYQLPSKYSKTLGSSCGYQTSPLKKTRNNPTAIGATSANTYASKPLRALAVTTTLRSRHTHHLGFHLFHLGFLCPSAILPQNHFSFFASISVCQKLKQNCIP